MPAKITRWTSPEPPTESTLSALLAAEGLDYYIWGNSPLDVYAAHTHAYDKVIYVLRGSITFGLPQSGQKLTLNAGDRLDLSAGTIHDAQVSIQGVTCLEAHR
jgi:adhesin HecA-like repeat protein